MSHLERADVQFTVEVPVDTRLYMNLACRARHVDGKARSFAFHDEQSLVCSSCTSGDSPSDFHVTAISLGSSHCSHLQDLYFPGNRLSEVNLSGCAGLETLHLGDHRLREVGLSGCSGLKSIYIRGSLLSSIDLSRCAKLLLLFLAGNGLSEIAFDRCGSLHLMDLKDTASLGAGS